MNSTSLDKRQNERIATDRPVTLTLSPTQTIQGKMINLSTQGTGILIHAEPFNTTEIKIEFLLPTTGNHPIIQNAIIVHKCMIRQAYLLGLEFVINNAQNEHVIREFIRYHHRLD